MNSSRSRNPFDSDEDVEANLLRDQRRDVDRAEQMQLVPAEAPRLTRLQRGVGAVVRHMNATQVVGLGAVMFRSGNLEGVQSYSVVKYCVTTAAVILVREGQGAMNAGIGLEHPLRYHCALGGGSFAAGLVRDVKRKAIIAVPVIGVLTGLGAGRDALFNWAMMNSHTYLVMVMFTLDSPVVRTMVIGALALLGYEQGQRILNCISPLPEVPLEVDPQLRWYQSGLKGVSRIFYGAVAGEFIRSLCNDAIGFAYLFQTRMSLMAGPYYDFGLREPAQYYSSVPRPFEKLDLSCTRPTTVVAIDEDDDFEDAPVRLAPSRCRQVSGLSTRVAIVIMVLGAATVANYFIAPKFSGPDDDKKAGYNPSTWSTGGRMAYVGLMTGACAFVYGASMLMPETVQKAGRWCSNLFSRAPQPQAAVEMQPPASHYQPRS